MTIWRVRIACWIPEATNIHSDYVILITLSQQQRLHACASVLRYMYIGCLVIKKLWIQRREIGTFEVHSTNCLLRNFMFMGPCIVILCQ